MAGLPDSTKLQFQFPAKLRNIAIILIVLGAAVVASQIFFPIGAEEGDKHPYGRLFMSLHVALLVGLPLALGGVYFAAVHHISGAAWSTSVRRIAEGHWWFLPVVFLMFLVMLTGFGDVFHHWVYASPDDKLIEWKSPWLDTGFFIVRNIIIFIIWIFFGWLFWKKSTDQDKDGKVSHSKTLIKLSAGFLVVMGLTLSTNSWDLSMSLEPHWFSTMWAIYIFAGMALVIFASIILWVFFLKKSGYLGDAVNDDHIHDLGKYLWGHSIFWAYIAICQYLLIWYAHIPEETIFYRIRLFDENMNYNAWGAVSLLLFVIRFFLPFFLLLKRESKRNIKFLAIVAGIVLFGQLVDMYWVAYPTIDHGHFILYWLPDVGPLLIMAGLYLLVVGKALASKPLIPVKDPKLEECLHAHH